MKAKGLLAALYFMACSISMTLLNKHLMHTHHFVFPLLLLSLQGALALLVLPFVAPMRLEASKCRVMLPVALAYAAQVGASLVALNFLNVALYSTFKRLTVLFVLAGQVLLLRIYPSARVAASVLLLVSGAFLAGYADLAGRPAHLLVCLLACALQASHGLLYKRACRLAPSISVWEQLFYCSLLSLPLVLLASWATGDFAAAARFPWRRASFLVSLVPTMGLGILLTSAVLLCTRVTSPLTTVVCGQTKAVLQTVLGSFMLGGTVPRGLQLVGMLVTALGAALYAWQKYIESPPAKEKDDTQEEEHDAVV